ncbi:uncharacterized protein [Bemisia tabaci]|uniref:uncharacterized protein isoform X2 n=1 Tax=Bemisia tabaci TaxID=7038 RepID=UPI003B286B12
MSYRHMRDVEPSLEAVTLICTVAGLVPYDLRSGRLRPLGLLHTLAEGAALTKIAADNVFSPKTRTYSSQDAFNVLTSGTIFTFYICLFCLVSTTLCRSIVHARRRVAILRQVTAINRKLRQLHLSHEAHSFRRIILTFFVIIGSIATGDVIIMHFLRKKPLWMVLNKMLHIYSFYLIVIPTMLNFTTFMKVFNLKFRLVNDFLESYVIRYDQTELEKKPRQPIDVILKDVVVVHSMLRNAIDEHNELYSVQILFFLATCFTNFNSNVFFFFFASPNKIQTIYCLYWSSMHFFILTMLLRETSNAKIEALVYS